MKTLNERSEWRRKNLKLVYAGSNTEEREAAEVEFWRTASDDAKHQAMADFVHDELERFGLLEHGPKLLRLTATIRRPQS
jgi:hypothetical protein